MENITCFGDSITAGFPFAEGRRWTARLQASLDAIAPDSFAVYSRGVGGRHTGDAITRFEAEVRPHLPGHVLIEYGFNDASVVPGCHVARVPLAAFAINLQEIVRLVRCFGGKPVLIANHPIRCGISSEQGNGRSYHENYAPYQREIHEVAARTGAPLIDLEAALAGTPLDELLSVDGLHLSEEGNRHYAAAVLSCLKPLLGLE